MARKNATPESTDPTAATTGPGPGLAPSQAGGASTALPGPGDGEASAVGALQATPADGGATGSEAVSPGAGADDVQAPENPNLPVVQIYPLRSYMDADELRRRGGPAYSAPRRHADDLVQRKLASFEPLE